MYDLAVLDLTPPRLSLPGVGGGALRYTIDYDSWVAVRSVLIASCCDKASGEATLETTQLNVSTSLSHNGLGKALQLIHLLLSEPRWDEKYGQPLLCSRRYSTYNLVQSLETNSHTCC